MCFFISSSYLPDTGGEVVFSWNEKPTTDENGQTLQVKPLTEFSDFDRQDSGISEASHSFVDFTELNFIGICKFFGLTSFAKLLICKIQKRLQLQNDGLFAPTPFN